MIFFVCGIFCCDHYNKAPRLTLYITRKLLLKNTLLNRHFSFWVHMKLLLTLAALLIALSLSAQTPTDSATLYYQRAYIIEMGNDTVPGDIYAAIPLYRRAADLGLPAAQSYLGFCYYNGLGIQRDTEKGIRWIQQAANQGDIKAANNLGFIFAQGDPAIRDYTKAATWFAKASDAGLPVAHAQLADLYRQGLGVECDTIMARNLYRKAIAAGLADAERKLLAMDHPQMLTLSADEALRQGIDYDHIRAYDIAATLFEISLDKDHPYAALWLAQCYAHGRGVAYDFDRALELYYRAACEGVASAQFIVGETLEMFPDAFPADGHGAQYWLDLARQSGVNTSQDAQRMMYPPQPPK